LFLSLFEILQDSKKKLFTKIAKYCKETPNSSNAILLLKLCGTEISNLKYLNTRLEEIFSLQFHLTIDLRNTLSLNNYEKQIPIYELFGVENLKETSKLDEVLKMFQSSNANDIVEFYSSFVSFKDENYEKSFLHFEKLSKFIKSSCSLFQLKYLISNSKSLEFILLDSTIPQELIPKIEHLNKLFNQSTSKIEFIEEDKHSTVICELQKEIKEMDVIFQELNSFLSFVQIIHSCQNCSPFNLYKLFSMNCLIFLFPEVPKKNMKEKQNFNPSRKEYLVKLSRTHLKESLLLCDSFQISRDFVHLKYIIERYQKYEDQDAAMILLKVKDRVKVGKEMVEIARSRFGLIFQHLSTDKKNLPLLSNMPVQLFQWISNQMSDTNHDIEIVILFIYSFFFRLKDL
jgi:hypothetical protein